MAATITQLLKEATVYLRSKGFSSPRLEAEVLFSYFWGKDRSYLYAHGEEKVDKDVEEELWALIKRRGEGVPAAYITGQKEFMGLNFYVEEGVFIPRPETEHLIESVLYWMHKRFDPQVRGEEINILELGSGSGNIAISLAYYMPGVKVVAVELEEKPLKLARLNAEKMGVDGRIVFLQGSFFEPLYNSSYKFHLIVSNPPYILMEEMPLLPSEVQNEPAAALNGGILGLDSYKEIFARAKDFLFEEGLLALELEEERLKDIIKLAEEYGFFQVEVKKDYAGRERVAVFAVQEEEHTRSSLADQNKKAF